MKVDLTKQQAIILLQGSHVTGGDKPAQCILNPMRLGRGGLILKDLEGDERFKIAGSVAIIDARVLENIAGITQNQAFALLSKKSER